MPILLLLGNTLLHTLIGLAMSLVSEEFLKKAILLGLNKLVAKSDSDLAKQLVAAADSEWNKPASPPAP